MKFGFFKIFKNIINSNRTNGWNKLNEKKTKWPINVKHQQFNSSIIILTVENVV